MTNDARERLEVLALPSTRQITVKPDVAMSVSDLEHALLRMFPSDTAESWDLNGLRVGNPSDEVRGIAIALDPTVDAIEDAHTAGANVLLTHHPVFLDAPTKIVPESATGAMAPQTCVWQAIRDGVSLMNFHTSLDVSHNAAEILPELLHLVYQGTVLPIDDRGLGYGQLCTLRDMDRPMNVGQLAARCVSVFQRQPRVWGSLDGAISHVVTATGSAGNLLQTCVERGYDCLVCGEVHYHDALAASQAGLSIIELGHDVSEIPLCAVLVAAVKSLGFRNGSLIYVNQSSNWTVPETVRK